MVCFWNEIVKFMCAHMKWSSKHMTKWKKQGSELCVLPFNNKRDGVRDYTDTHISAWVHRLLLKGYGKNQ